MKIKMNESFFMKLILIFLLIVISTGMSYSEANINVESAVPSECSIYFEDQLQFVQPYNINGSNYLMLRDLARLLRNTRSEFAFVWNEKLRQIEISTGKSMPFEEKSEWHAFEKTLAYDNKLTILVDGKETILDSYIIKDKTYFGLRAISELTGSQVEWYDDEKAVRIYAKLPENVIRVGSSVIGYFNDILALYPKYQRIDFSYLYEDLDRIIMIDEANSMNISTYDKEFNFMETQALERELPLFGGFFSGKNYNYLVFGDKNNEEDNNKEVIRIVKYDKDFNRLGSVSINGGDCYTIEPFSFGSSSIIEKDNNLVIHTTRRRYLTPDGLNHQSQLTIIIDTHQMIVKNNLGPFQPNHVSHSFGQYAKYDGKKLVLVDHGDAYPRSVVMNIETFESSDEYKKVDFFKIPGVVGANSTGVDVGGFEITPSHYLIAMNSIDHSKVTTYEDMEIVGLEVDQRDVLILALPKSSLNFYAVDTTLLYKYVGTDEFGSELKLVKVTDDLFVVLWQEFDFNKEAKGVKYVVVNGCGSIIKPPVHLLDYKLSDMQPVVIDQQIIWYLNREKHRLFYTIPVDDMF